MTRKPALFIIVLFFALLSACTNKSQVPDGLPRSIPETEGVSSEGILNFLDAVEKSKHELHSFMFLRHGKVIAEGWWNPYRSDLKHTMYSTSKSFTSTAIGFAVSENRLSVNDKVISFFPKDIPDTISPNLAALTVKDLLTMSVGQEPDPSFSIVSKDTNWIKAFLALPVKYKPGSKFLYNSMATYMLSAIVQKVTGEKVIDYLKPRLFEPLNIQGMDWETDPMGISTGGWGLRIKTEDMAKFGQLYLKKGKWNDMQVIPAEWIEEATSYKIDQAPNMPKEKKDLSEWTQGYCYQFWRCRHNAFRADGAYGQYIIMMPDQDAVVVLTSETSDMQREINLVWEYLLPAIKGDKLTENNDMVSVLNKRLESLALPVIGKSSVSPLENTISGKTYSFAPNEKQIETIDFQFQKSECLVNLTIDSVAYKVAFGSGTWKLGETMKPGPSLFSKSNRDADILYPAKVAGNYAWKNDSTLELKLRYIESPHSETILCRFSQDKIGVELQNSNDFGSKKMELTGELKR